MIGVLAVPGVRFWNRTNTARAPPSAARPRHAPAAVARRVGSRCSPNLLGRHPRTSSQSSEPQLRWSRVSGAVGGVYRMCDIVETRISILEGHERFGWTVGQSVSFCNDNAGTMVSSSGHRFNLSTTLESDGRGHFTFSSTGQRFAGTTTNDGATKIFRPIKRVVIDGFYLDHAPYTIKGVLECVRATLRP